MDVSAFLRDLEGLPWVRDQIVHREDVAARPATLADLERALDPRLEQSLSSAGIESLYSHQAEAINAVRNGENVVVATAAASGKSLCYHLPVLDSLLEDRSARALLLFPTKALAQDQYNGMAALAPKESRVRHDIFDGDTPSEERGDNQAERQDCAQQP